MFSFLVKFLFVLFSDFIVVVFVLFSLLLGCCCCLPFVVVIVSLFSFLNFILFSISDFDFFSASLLSSSHIFLTCFFSGKGSLLLFLILSSISGARVSGGSGGGGRWRLGVEWRLLAVLGELKSLLLEVVMLGEVKGISEGLMLDRVKGISEVVMLGGVEGISVGVIMDSVLIGIGSTLAGG